MNRQDLFCAVAAIAALCAPDAKGDVRLPTLFSDHMVLQRDVAVPVWGWADAGERVTVRIDNQEKTALPDGTGKWMVKLDPLKTGEPRILVVKGKNTLTIQDVLVGEVWLGTGQSNMDFALGWKGEENIAAAATLNDPQLRYFDVPHKGSLTPESDVVAHWQLGTPGNARGWSAIGAYFGKNLREKLGVPVAFIKSSYGGTPPRPGLAWKRWTATPRGRRRQKRKQLPCATCQRTSKLSLTVWKDGPRRITRRIRATSASKKAGPS